MDAPRVGCFSTPLLSTWVFDETHRLLFDAGDGVTALLDSKIHKIRLVALTHTHRDHCAGLMQLLNLRGGAGDLRVVFPEGSGSARALSNFLSHFDSRTSAMVEWRPVSPGESIEIEPARHFLRTFETKHYPSLDPPRTLSLGYQIVREVNKVKREFEGLSQTELDAVRLRHGRDFITEVVEDILLSVTGDTTPLDPAVYRGSRVLLHECTFLDSEEKLEQENLGHPHTSLEEAMMIAREAGVGRLGLYHISRRYEDSSILQRVRQAAEAAGLDCSVSVALPGRQYDDLFAHTVWQGNAESA